ncbi:hypothetical protein GCM10012290_17910 [Halolactibacillus alkaliphilus]|uniref:Helix-turn-helix domain-containing protein n=1 Tax=Halolactibacillus alkaliphilus TaxID=442899 RepID=A0A511X2H8_9BACI|nr:excisionase family DNA-binding protein [Halolactibacillus alkaliphilus]GEN57146.1 hypothetical protein HAL01_16100 [Halolactibacillus alkaliphilus]GGN72175.1 hypothetical protein GCM10012290_17910 [Halolactibacillus alkaliphilus]SFO88266.1 DNA binding domain-containing protein, excisionase family [Halolactibacillus alkaliphilus]
MFVSIKEAAAYLEINETDLRKLIFDKKIKAFHDGEQYLVNTAQFDTHLKEMDRIRADIQAYLAEPVPESLFVRDED